MTTTRTNTVVSTLFTLFGGPGLTLVLVPWTLTRFRVPAQESPAKIVAAVALIAIGLIPLLDSIIRFVVIGRGTLVPAVPTQHLVITGLYRYLRNPMYTGVVTAIAGETILFWSRHMVEYVAFVWLIMHLFVCFYEEPTLARTHGDEYALFKKNVPRWIPRLTPWRPDPSV